jgi:hypothetical protein
MHAEKNWTFAEERMKLYTEFDLQIKFWSYIFETFFGKSENIMLRWYVIHYTLMKVKIEFFI